MPHICSHCAVQLQYDGVNKRQTSIPALRHLWINGRWELFEAGKELFEHSRLYQKSGDEKIGWW